MKNNNQQVDYRYLSATEADRRFGLWINTVGCQVIPPGTDYPLEGHPAGYFFNAATGRVLHEYQLVYITEGTGTFCSSADTPEQEVQRGRVMMIFPGQWHSYQPYSSTGWTEYYIGFAGPIADNLIREGFFSSRNQMIEVGLNEELVALFTRAIMVSHGSRSAQQQHMAGLLMHIIGLILTISRDAISEVGDINQKIERAKIVMRENMGRDLDMVKLASSLNVSYSWFRKMFRESTGLAPVRYFHEMKMTRAKQLLVDTTLSVKEVAFRLGFKSTEHFFSVFKKYTKLTPTEYRTSRRKQADLT